MQQTNMIHITFPERFGIEPLNLPIKVIFAKMANVKIGDESFQISLSDLASLDNIFKKDYKNGFVHIYISELKQLEKILSCICASAEKQAINSYDAYIVVKSAGIGSTDKSRKVKVDAVWGSVYERQKTTHTITIARSVCVEENGVLLAPRWLLAKRLSKILKFKPTIEGGQWIKDQIDYVRLWEKGFEMHKRKFLEAQSKK